jgi:hypothetical protein
MEQALITLLDEYLKLNYIPIDSPEYYDQINVDETMRRLKIQARLRLKRTMTINQFGADQGTFFFLMRSYNKKKMPFDQVWQKSKAPAPIIDKLKTEAGFKPPVYTLMRILLAMELSEMDAYNLISEAEMTIRTYEYLDLIVLFCLRHKIYDVTQVNQLLALKQVAPL